MMKTVLTLLTLMFCLQLRANADVEIVVPSTVEVSPRAEITMYDVIEAKNLNDDTVSELQNIVIGGDKLSSLSKGELAKLFRHVKARYVLPNELKLIRSHGTVSRMEVERKIKNKIYSECNGCDVQIIVSNVPQNIESDWVLDLNIDMTKKTVMVPVYSVKNSSSKAWIVVEVKRYQKVKYGEVITPEMLTIEKRELLNVRDTYVSAASLDGMQAVRFLNAGQVIQFSDVKREQILKKGQMVKAIVGSPSFEVAISAEVQEAGSVGDVVKVKNLDSQKVFAAKIVERGVVRIE
jgi:flagellar basal body P-ring formation protein FlgA